MTRNQREMLEKQAAMEKEQLTQQQADLGYSVQELSTGRPASLLDSLVAERMRLNKLFNQRIAELLQAENSLRNSGAEDLIKNAEQILYKGDY